MPARRQEQTAVQPSRLPPVIGAGAWPSGKAVRRPRLAVVDDSAAERHPPLVGRGASSRRCARACLTLSAELMGRNADGARRALATVLPAARSSQPDRRFSDGLACGDRAMGKVRGKVSYLLVEGAACSSHLVVGESGRETRLGNVIIRSLLCCLSDIVGHRTSPNGKRVPLNMISSPSCRMGAGSMREMRRKSAETPIPFCELRLPADMLLRVKSGPAATAIDLLGRRGSDRLPSANIHKGGGIATTAVVVVVGACGSRTGRHQG